jgi:hypothetical protein
MNRASRSVIVTMIVSTGASLAAAQSTTPPLAVAPYSLSVFARAPQGLSAPDSIAVLHGHVFVGYGDGHDPGGADGLSSQIVDFAADGRVNHIYTVKGHNDGLKVDPATGRLWALQNEDASPNLVIIDPERQHQSQPFIFSATPHGGGYDDLVFRDCKVYVSASNPANNPNTGPAIVSARLENGVVQVEPLLAGTASATDIPTDATVQLNLQDPDSMTLDPLGNIVLDSQADQELLLVSNPGEKSQRVLRLPLSYLSSGAQTPVEVDDTAFVTSSEGYILFADKGLNTVFMLQKKAFVPMTAYTAADGGPFVGSLDLTSGVITPLVTGLVSPGGLVFVDTSARHRAESHEGECRRDPGAE